MKHRLLYAAIAIEALVLGSICIFADVLPGWFSTVFAFPFEQIGGVLKALASSGNIGNGLASMVWIGLSFIPVALVLLDKAENSRRLENVSLCLLSLVTAVCLYCMINPTAFYPSFVGAEVNTQSIMKAAAGADIDAQRIIKAVAGGTLWSAIICCVILRTLRLFKSGNTKELLKYAKVLLYILCILFTGMIFLPCLSSLLSGLRGAASFADAVLALLSFCASALPYVMDIVVTICAVSLLEAFLSPEPGNTVEQEYAAEQANNYEIAHLEQVNAAEQVYAVEQANNYKIIHLEDVNAVEHENTFENADPKHNDTDEQTNAVDISKKLSRLCCLTLALVTLSNVALNTLQLILASKLSNVNVTIDIPFMSIAFVLGVLLLSRLIDENKKLSDDNDLFI